MTVLSRVASILDAYEIGAGTTLADHVVHIGNTPNRDLETAAADILDGRDSAGAFLYGQFGGARMLRRGTREFVEVFIRGFTTPATIWLFEWEALRANWSGWCRSLDERGGTEFPYWIAKRGRPVWLLIAVEIVKPKRRELGRVGAENHPRPKAYLNVREIAGHVFSRDLVPVDSLNEADFADYLVDLGRSFRKPVRYVPIVDEDYPDFLLLDHAPPVIVEVWGFEDADYLARKEVKVGKYSSENSRLVEWNAVKNDPFPVVGPGARDIPKISAVAPSIDD